MADMEGGAAGAAAFDGNISHLPELVFGKYSRDRFIQECAMALFCNTEFKSCGMTAESVAKLAVQRANILANELKI